MPALSPIESEFASTEEAEAHDAWFRAKVREALDDPSEPIPHDQVMAEIQAIIDAHKPKA
ncbi:MAG: stability determinant [Caulobacteraceae bacterium]|nr:MAG: stability determinant [Caulobacteraceae bacterium]